MGGIGVSDRRLLELWEPPPGHRLVSAIATTYELQADFLEEDLLPVALDLRLASARGRDFRLELERALQDTEVTVFFHPDRYQAGLRRSPRIDLVPLPEGRFSKLHAKIALLRFVDPDDSSFDRQVVRLVVGSANLTSAGYRSNIEVAAAVDDTPEGPAACTTAVRDAAAWLENVVGPSTPQVTRQMRGLRAVFEARPSPARHGGLQFIGLPGRTGFPALGTEADPVRELTVASPFWPSGDDLTDVASALRRLCGGAFSSARLIGPAHVDEHGIARPVIPAELVRSLLGEGARVWVAAADPGHGCDDTDAADPGEFDEVASRRHSAAAGYRELHAKIILAVSDTTARLAMGSFNLTRKGLSIARPGNIEAGVLWTVPVKQVRQLRPLFAFAKGWRKIERTPETFVVEPGAYDADDGTGWPGFILSLRAHRNTLVLVGDTQSWPDGVAIHMRDIRSRLVSREEWFDTWHISAEQEQDATFTRVLTLHASWMAAKANTEPWPALPDLEVQVSWDGHRVTIPVLFEDKHDLPVVESRRPDDELTLITWFLGLRPVGEPEDSGFGHSVDPVADTHHQSGATSEILSYLVRDFVHALPGIRSRLVEGGLTEPGLRAALLGYRSPVQLAREVCRALDEPPAGSARKTRLATAFQLTELVRLLRNVELPALEDNVTEVLRREAITEVQTALDGVVSQLEPSERSPIMEAFLAMDPLELP